MKFRQRIIRQIPIDGMISMEAEMLHLLSIAMEIKRSYRASLGVAVISFIVNLISPLSSSAQVILNQANTTGAYTAPHTIELNPGFSADGANGTFSATIVAPPVANCVPLAATPSANANYISTLTPRQPFTDASSLSAKNTCEVMQTIQYFDGLGRPLQTVQVKGNPDATKDVVIPMAYDQFGREATKYLPYTTASGGSGSYQPNAFADQLAFYNPIGTPSSVTQLSGGFAHIPSPYATTIFEASPLNRAIEVGAPGDPWQPVTNGHTTKSVYATNDATGLNIGTGYWAKQFGVVISSTGQRSLVDQGAYGQNQLRVLVTMNENWVSGKAGTTEEYYDKQNKMVLKRTFNNNNGTIEVYSTYFVYDDFDKLCFALAPKTNPDNSTVSSPMPQNVIDKLCFQYQYDERQRLCAKRIPGTDWQYLIYNRIDQVVATQDGNQRIKNEWTVVKFDALSRNLVTGIWNNNNTALDPAVFRDSVYAQSVQWEFRDNSQANGYTLSNTYPKSGVKILTINYYDDYNFPLSNPYPYAYNSQIVDMPLTQSAMTHGLLTGTKVAVLNTIGNNIPDMLWTVTYYDDKARVVQINSQHYLSGSINNFNYDQISNGYNFSNDVTQTIRTHYNSSSTTPALTIVNSMLYDHVGRKRQTFQQINGGTNLLLAQQDYNEIGQLAKKHYHSIDNGSTFLQNVAYNYNERGWVVESSAEFFDEKLKYNLSTPGRGANPQYNGNIAEQEYTADISGTQWVTYTYDDLNRLTNGISTSGFSESAINYDKGGNLTTLTRSNFGTLNYTYDNGGQSNQLVSTTGFSTGTYQYDPNGNKKTENTTLNGGGISNFVKNNSIDYNFLNLPQGISGTQNLTFTYDATGEKLKKVSNGVTTDYINGIHYTNGVLDFLQTEEGRILISGNNFNYEYTLTDHLGNNRVTFDTFNNTANKKGEEDYYPYGFNVHRRLNAGNKYLYNKKELQEELNEYDYGSRLYDAVIGRFSTVDKFSEKYMANNPYQYAALNPISNIDIHGDSVGVDKSVTQNKTINKAFNKFASTKAGQKYLAQYAAKGQTIAGHTYKESGRLNDKGIDINYSAKSLNDPSVGGKTDATVGANGRENIEVSLNTQQSPESKTPEEAVFNKIVDIAHETFIHADLSAKDFLDDGKVNYSNISPSIKNTPGMDVGHYQHLKVLKDYMKNHDYYNGNAFPLQSYQVIQEVNQSNQMGKTPDQIVTAIWTYVGGATINSQGYRVQ